MSEDINRVVLTGRLTADPELRRTQSGTAVMNFSIASNERRKNSQTGEWDDYANFIDCTMFGSRAESLSNILSKGKQVAIDGSLRWSSWERDGQKRSKVEVSAAKVKILTPKGYQGQQQGGYYEDYSDAF